MVCNGKIVRGKPVRVVMKMNVEERSPREIKREMVGYYWE